MRLPEEGLPAYAILLALQAFKGRDLDWRDGRTWAYVYPAGRDVERIGKAAYMAYLTENGLDPTVFPSVMVLENQIVSVLADHLGGDGEVVGNFTSGGTESILMACKTARDRARDLQPHITRPNIVLPVTAHAAFHKACRYFDLEPRLVEVDPVSFRATAEAMEAAIDEQTVLLVASSPSYAHGVIDDIEGIGAVAEARDLLFHVDACVGGWLLPFFRELGAPVPRFDFSVPGVTSISTDLHKYAFCPKGASVVLYRSDEIRRYQYFSGSNWTGYTVINPTVQSTKTGGPVAAAWAVMQYLGREGYRDKAEAILSSTRTIIDAIDAMPELEVMGRPDFCLIAFTSEIVNVFHVADEMRRRGWYIQPQLGYRDHRHNVHISVTPGTAANTEEMLSDLGEAVRAAGDMASTGLAERVQATLRTMDTARLSEEGYRKLLHVAGIEGNDLPERMAGINEVLNSLPVDLNESLITRYVASLNRMTPELEAELEGALSRLRKTAKSTGRLFAHGKLGEGIDAELAWALDPLVGAVRSMRKWLGA